MGMGARQIRFSGEGSDVVVGAVPVYEFGDTDFEGSGGGETDIGGEVGDVGAGRFDVAVLHREGMFACGLAEGGFEDSDEALE